MAGSKKRVSKGFTVVELLIVVVVIAILAALVFVTYTGIKQKDRDGERKSDVNILSGKLEAYWDQNEKYPTLANINDSTWRTTNMKDLDAGALKDPKAKKPVMVTSPSASAYSYSASPASCDNGANGDCTSYTLTATLEGGGNYVKQSLN